MSSIDRVYTFRDAGLQSTPLRALNWLGNGLSRVGFTRPRLSPEALLTAARRKAGLDDFGNGAFREALEVLSESLEREANLTPFGRLALHGMVVDALANRLRLLAWAKERPEVRKEPIRRPWVTLGLPRTGTSLLSILLGLDPTVRPLLQWEASHPVPPPELATVAEDSRLFEAARQLDRFQALNPPIQAMHPIGATLATECVTLMIFDLCALLLETQAHLPSYGRWLEKADMRGAYAMHRLALQTLQSRMPTETWSLKSPNHLWCLDTLLEFYPDARLIWTHRDPRKVVPSVASLVTSLHSAFTRRPDPMAAGSAWNHKLHLALTRGMEFDDRRRGRRWCCHVQYADLIADPVETVRRIYAHFEQELHPLHVRRMQTWMRDRPQDAFGRHGYDPSDFGLVPEEIDTRYADYRERFEVPEERT